MSADTFATALQSAMQARGLDDRGLAVALAGSNVGVVSDREWSRKIESLATNVWRWRTGRSTPRLTQLRLIAAALDTTVDALLEGGQQ